MHMASVRGTPRHDVGTGLENAANQSCQRLQGLRLLEPEGVAIVGATHAGNDVTKRALGRIGSDTSPAHERTCGAAQIVIGPTRERRGFRIQFLQIGNNALIELTLELAEAGNRAFSVGREDPALCAEAPAIGSPSPSWQPMVPPGIRTRRTRRGGFTSRRGQ